MKLKLDSVRWRARVSAWIRVRDCEAREDKSRGGKKKIIHGLVSLVA
jgi:hypothetical protein